jgi:KDO2-lipid IV(A) lauroyltransferase
MMRRATHDSRFPSPQQYSKLASPEYWGGGLRLRRKLILDYAVYLVVRLLICAVQALPLSVLEPVCNRLGWFCWHVLKLRRRTVKENLGIAFPEASNEERERTALAMWRHLFLMIAEIAHAPRKVHRSNWKAHSSISDMRAAIRTLIDARPKVIISGHLGNFELGGYLLALHGFPTHAIARPLDNVFLDRFVNKFRGATGQYMLPKQGSGPEVTELLERGGTLVLLGDQAGGKAGCWVDFFGKPASTHKAVAVFSLGSKAPTVVTAALRTGKPLSMRMEIGGVVDPGNLDFPWGSVPLLTQWYTKTLEDLVRRTPDQYWWVHRRWKGDPSDRKRVRSERQRPHAA